MFMFGGVAIKILFWNIYKKNFIDVLVEVITENQIDIIAMVECQKLDAQALINHLHTKAYDMKLVEICPENADIKLFAKIDLRITPKQENERFSVYKIKQDEETFLLTVLHLDSALYKEEVARDRRAALVSQQIEKIEDEIYRDGERKGIVVGDFNLQPYSYGVAGIDSFNATMSICKAKKIYRETGKNKKLFYFNPVWKLMGDNTLVQGSYYNNNDSQDKSIYWYAYDSVLLRPFFIDKFNWDTFGYITSTHSYSFVNKETINKSRYSDHLPILFEII